MKNIGAVLGAMTSQLKEFRSSAETALARAGEGPAPLPVD
jgi:hypothetical protein